MDGRPAAAPLTAREREIASLISRGLTNREIGLELSIKERTAGAHVQNILNKLAVNNRAQIAAWSVAASATPAAAPASSTIRPAPGVASGLQTVGAVRPRLRPGWLAGLMAALTLVVAATDDGAQASLPTARPPGIGALAYEAKLAGDGVGFTVGYSLGNPSWSAIRYLNGAVEYAVLHPEGNTGNTVGIPPMLRYFEEVELSVVPDSNVEFWMTLTSDSTGMSSHIVDLSTAAQALQLIYFADQVGQPLSPQVAVKGLQAGRPFTVSVLVNPPRYAVYLDGRQVIDVQHEVITGRRLPGFGVFGSSTGTVRLTRLRIFQVSRG